MSEQGYPPDPLTGCGLMIVTVAFMVFVIIIVDILLHIFVR
jgi:hypothetical protein